MRVVLSKGYSGFYLVRGTVRVFSEWAEALFQWNKVAANPLVVTSREDIKKPEMVTRIRQRKRWSISLQARRYPLLFSLFQKKGVVKTSGDNLVYILTVDMCCDCLHFNGDKLWDLWKYVIV